MAKTKPPEAPAPEPTVAPVKKPTQKQAVIAALAAGKESPPDGVKFVKDTFNIDLTKGNFSTIKSQVKKAGGTATPTRKPGAPNPFVDPNELQKFVADAEKDFDTELAKQQAAAK